MTDEIRQADEYRDELATLALVASYQLEDPDEYRSDEDIAHEYLLATGGL